jgi:hypothetical protein
MPDPYVREVGHMDDLDEMTVTVGIDYDSVTINPGQIRLGSEQIELFAQLFIAACREAGANSERMRAEVDPEEAAEVLAALRARLAGDDGV